MDLDNLDWRTRKPMQMCHALHPKGDTDQLYLLKAEVDRGRLQVKQTIEKEKHGLNDYFKKSQKSLLKEINQGKLLKTTKVELKQSNKKN